MRTILSVALTALTVLLVLVNGLPNSLAGKYRGAVERCTVSRPTIAAQPQQTELRVSPVSRTPVVIAVPPQIPLSPEIVAWLFALRAWLLAFPTPFQVSPLPPTGLPTVPLPTVAVRPPTVAVPQATPVSTSISQPSLGFNPKTPIAIPQPVPNPAPAPNMVADGQCCSTKRPAPTWPSRRFPVLRPVQ